MYLDFLTTDPRWLRRACDQLSDWLVLDTTAYRAWLDALAEGSSFALPNRWMEEHTTALLQFGVQDALARQLVDSECLHELACTPDLLVRLESRIPREADSDYWCLSPDGVVFAQRLLRAVTGTLAEPDTAATFFDTATSRRFPFVAGVAHVPLVDDTVLECHVGSRCVGKLHVQPSGLAVGIRFATGVFRAMPVPRDIRVRAAAASSAPEAALDVPITYTARPNHLSIAFRLPSG